MRIFLFLDYDGTLTPIAARPEEARTSKETRTLLKRLSKKVRLAVVSGRSLKDIKRLVGLKNIIYVGNHGLEMEGPRVRFEMPLPMRPKKALKRIREGLVTELAGVDGAQVEYKGLTLSLHYRLASKRGAALIKNIFRRIVRPHISKRQIVVGSGKKVFEVRPPVRWDKGRAVLWLLAREQALAKDRVILPVYIGDDATDEDAFRALKNKGLTIAVGRPGPSEAGYRLKDPGEVGRFLRTILRMLKGRDT